VSGPCGGSGSGSLPGLVGPGGFELLCCLGYLVPGLSCLLAGSSVGRLYPVVHFVRCRSCVYFAGRMACSLPGRLPWSISYLVYSVYMLCPAMRRSWSLSLSL
jgi:hypothetical protein